MSTSHLLCACMVVVGVIANSAHARQKISDLGTLGGSWSGAAGINAIGQIVGSSYTANDAESHGFIYSGIPGAGGAMLDLGTLVPTESQASCINASGQVAGSGSSAIGTSALRYTVTSGGVAIEDLGTLGGDLAFGYSINNSGQVAGWSTVSRNGVQHAFRYTGTPGHGGLMEDLGSLGNEYSEGYGINNSGQVVGYTTTPDHTAEHAFRYTGTPGQGWRDGRSRIVGRTILAGFCDQ